MKRKLPAMLVRCGNPSTGRRVGRPTCLHCWIELAERKVGKDLRRAGRKIQSLLSTFLRAGKLITDSRSPVKSMIIMGS